MSSLPEQTHRVIPLSPASRFRPKIIRKHGRDNPCLNAHRRRHMRNRCAGRYHKIARSDSLPCVFPVLKRHIFDPCRLVLRAVVPLQTDVLDIQPLNRVEHVLRRKYPMLLMLKLWVALPPQTDPKLVALGYIGLRNVGRPVDVLVLPAQRNAGRHARHPEVMHHTKRSLVLDYHVHAIDLPHGHCQSARAGHDNLVAARFELTGVTSAVDLIAQSAF